MKFVDFFSGIGGFRLGMEMAGHECVGHCEIDRYADKSYRVMHKVKESEFYANDITRIQPGDLPGADIYCGGFPCQSFSIAGKRGGFADTRGTLFFEVMRLAVVRKPTYLFLENVKGLLSHDNGNTFATIIESLWECGYHAEWQVLNSKDHGVPQNRERVFIVGHLRGQSEPKVFPIREVNCNSTGKYNIRVKNQTPCKLDKPFIDGAFSSMIGNKVSIRSIGEEVSGTVTARYYKGIGANGDNMVLVREATSKGYAEAEPGDSINLAVPNSNTRRGRVGKGLANTLDTGCQQAVVGKNLTIRKLTPLECFRLQGFPDEYFRRAAEVNSDSQLYKQAGNSVTVNVIHEIARRL